MSRINAIQSAITELDGGTFQKLLDVYLYKKNGFNNIQPLGVQTGTNKVTKGIPDSFIKHEDGTYTLIMYGSVTAIPLKKIKEDILSCYEKDKLRLEEEKIKKIICAYTSTNIHIEHIEELENLIPNVKIEMLGLGTISHDLLVHFPTISADFLNISIDTEQIFTPDDFVKKYDKNGMNAPLSIDFKYRETEYEELIKAIEFNTVTLVSGQSGIGKTRLVIEGCKAYEQNGYKVFCIKNNGGILYDDVRYYLSDPGNYLLFIDDANQTTSLDYILSYVTDPPKDVTIKIVATVRDYAKKRLDSIIRKYFKPYELSIGPFQKEQIKNILNDNLGIKNNDYLNKIAIIAKGNARLAILAGTFAIEKGYKAINNATDIFKNYYGDIMNTQKLQTETLYSLFIVSFLGPFRIDENDFAARLLEHFGMDDTQFSNCCHELNEKELLDLHYDKVVKVSDQSFGNYILEYILIEKKNISISGILDLGFPKYKNKIIYALNTIIDLFRTDDIEKYIEFQVNKSWESAESSLQGEYLKCFYNLNMEKALQMIKNSIDEMEARTVDMSTFDFEKHKNYHSISNDQISILGGFKYSKYFRDAIELLLYLFDVRPDLVMELYFTFTTKYSFDLHSHSLDYEKEYQLVKFLWEFSKYRKNDVHFLILHILDNMLDCQIHRTEPGDSGKSVTMVSFSIAMSPGTEKLRRLIWGILSKLYTQELYQKKIHSILSHYRGSGLDSKQIVPIIETDMKCIKELFVDHWDKLSFEQSEVLKKIVTHAERLKITYDKAFDSYKSNKDFMLYDLLTSEHHGTGNWVDEEINRKQIIEAVIREYRIEDFDYLFELCKKLEADGSNEGWLIGNSIFYIFSILHGNSASAYVEILKIYLANNAPFAVFVPPDSIIQALIEIIGVSKTKALLDDYKFDNKQVWLCNFWESIPSTLLKSEHVEGLLEFVVSEEQTMNPVVPSVAKLKEYLKLDPEIVLKVGKLVVEMSEIKQSISAQFLHGVYDESSFDELLEIFASDIQLLEKIYLQALNNHFDYEGKLLVKLVAEDYNFWDLYTNTIAQDSNSESYSVEIFKKIWLFDNYSELVEIAFDNILEKELNYISEIWCTIIFPNDNAINKQLNDRKKLWFKNYIFQNHLNLSKMKKIFSVLNTVMPNDKLEYFLEYVKYSKDIEAFKKLPITPLSDSWSGSQVPIIDKKIEFVTELMDNLQGFIFIEHRAFLKQLKDHFEKYRNEIQVTEYLEDFDLA